MDQRWIGILIPIYSTAHYMFHISWMDMHHPEISNIFAKKERKKPVASNVHGDKLSGIGTPARSLSLDGPLATIGSCV